jgi:hypothetical protein
MFDSLFMKTLLFLGVIVVAFLFSCKKSGAGGGGSGNAGLVNSWQLVQVNVTAGANSFIETPSADSSVLLTFKPDSTYASFLNGQPVAQGSFSFGADTIFPGWQLLKMKNFETTGLLWATGDYEAGPGGQLILIDDRTDVNISHDTLYLTPNLGSFGGLDIFVFLKQ